MRSVRTAPRGLRQRPSCRAFGVVAALMLSGCATTSEETAKAIAGLQTEIVALRASSGALSERLEALELRAGVHRREPPDEGRDLPVVRLAPPEEAAASEDPVAPRGPDEGATVRIHSNGKSVVSEDRPREPKTKENDKSSALADTEFLAAKALYDEKQWPEALSKLGAWIVRFPDSPRVPEATLLRGLAFVKQGEATKASEQFASVVSLFPKSEWAPEALYEEARVKERAADFAGRDRLRKQLRTSYPKSPAAKRLDKR